MGLCECKITEKIYLSKDQFILTFESKEISSECKPGQFVNVSCDKFLKRPISIYSANKDSGLFSIAIRVKGEGTAYLETKNPGESLSILGPLGNGFDLQNVSHCVMVGGGIGIYPLIYLLEEARKLGIKTTSICGFRSREDSFLIDDIKLLSDNVVFASECGDMDVCGNAVDAMKHIDLNSSYIFTCGPMPMMKAVSEVAIEKNIPCQVSLEQRMGCGTGICLVCACKVKTSEDDFGYKRCCKDGPVFDAREVLWD